MKPNYRIDALDRIRLREKERAERVSLRLECASCGALIRDGALTPDGHASHGLCVPCAKEWRRDAGLPE